MSRMRSKALSVKKVDEEGLKSVFFANQYSLLNPDLLYLMIKKFLEEKKSYYTQVDIGVYALNTTLTGKFLKMNFIDCYEFHESIIICNAFIIESGNKKAVGKIYDCGYIDKTQVRFVINLPIPIPEEAKRKDTIRHN